MMDFDDMELEESAASRGWKQFGRFLAIGIILVVAGFGDAMYIQLMSSHFPAGLLLTLCYVGAFTSFLAVAYMLIGKSILFTPGVQSIVAWFIFIVELALIALNIILVFQSDGTNSTGFLAAWLQLAPATPVANMAGVAVLFFLDEEGRMRHEDMELALDMKRAKRRHFKAFHRAQLRLQNKQLNFLVTELDRAVASPESMAAIQQTAIDMNTHLLGQLSGGRTYRLPAALPQAAPVEGSLAQLNNAGESTPTSSSEKKGNPLTWLKSKMGGQQPATPTADLIAPTGLEKALVGLCYFCGQAEHGQPGRDASGHHIWVCHQCAAKMTSTPPADAAPATEQLAPFTVAPTQSGNGANHK